MIWSDGFRTIGPSADKDGDGVAAKIGIEVTEPMTGFAALARASFDMLERDQFSLG